MGPGVDDVVAVATPAQAPVDAAPATAPTAVVTAAPAPAAQNTPAPSTTAAVAPPATAPAAHSVSFPVRPATATNAHVATPIGHAPGADAGSIGGAVFSLLLVIGLILGLGWLAKRMPGMNRGAGSSQLKIVASVALGPRDRAVVLDVGGQQLLVGVGQGGVRTLHTLEHPLPVAESTAPSAFAQVLAQHFGRKS
jgi:flagellar protein FliO/FliZ